MSIKLKQCFCWPLKYLKFFYLKQNLGSVTDEKVLSWRLEKIQYISRSNRTSGNQFQSNSIKYLWCRFCCNIVNGWKASNYFPKKALYHRYFIWVKVHLLRVLSGKIAGSNFREFVTSRKISNFSMLHKCFALKKPFSMQKLYT